MAMTQLASAAAAFDKNVQAVLQLSDLDRGLLDVAIKAIEERDQRLLRSNVENPRMLAGPTLENLRNVRQHDSLRPGFQALVDQSVVLLTSYFASGVSELFQAAIAAALDAKPSDHLRSLQLKLSVGELAELGPEFREVLPSIIAESPGISFQDTKSIARTFAEFFGVAIPRDDITNDITAGLAFRHVLVHNGGIVDRQCLRQLKQAMPRSLRSQVALGHSLAFASEEIELLAKAMLRYVQRLAMQLEVSVSETDTQAAGPGEAPSKTD